MMSTPSSSPVQMLPTARILEPFGTCRILEGLEASETVESQKQTEAEKAEKHLFKGVKPRSNFRYPEWYASLQKDVSNLL